MIFDNNALTDNAEIIASKIEQSTRANGPMTAADLYRIIDILETHFDDTAYTGRVNRNVLLAMTERWKRELESEFPEMELV